MLLSSGGGLVTMQCIAFKWGNLRYGGSPYDNSNATMPKDQMSTF